MKSLVFPAVVLFAAATSVAPAAVLEVRTTSVRPTEPPPTWPSAANRLFLSGTGGLPDVAAPLGTTVWIVADSQNNGLPALSYDTPGAGSPVPKDQLLGADDFIVRVDRTDGAAPGSIPGRYFSGSFTIDDAFRTANFYFLVWNSAGGAPADLAGVPADGSASFGLFDMGTAVFPVVGNGGLGVYENVYADGLTVVPEPSAYAAAGAVSLLAYAAWRRRAARAA